MTVWKQPFSKIPSLAALRRSVLRAKRSADQRCSECARKLFPGDGKLCDDCREAKRRAVKTWRAANPEKARQVFADFQKKNRVSVNAKARAYRDAQKLEGTCVKCTEPCLEDSEFCDKHREQSRAKARRYIAKKRAQVRSGIPQCVA